MYNISNSKFLNMISESHIIQFYESIIYDVILIQKISPMHSVLASGQK